METKTVIPHEKAYRHTKSTVEGFETFVADYRAHPERSKLSPRMSRAVIEAHESLIEEWSEQLREYEQLKAGQATLSLRSLADLPALLVKARLAAGLTQKQLAEKLGLKPQQVSRYEKTGYRGVSIERAEEVANALGVRWEGVVHVGRDVNQFSLPNRRDSAIARGNARDRSKARQRPTEKFRSRPPHPKKIWKKIGFARLKFNANLMNCQRLYLRG